MRVAGAGGAAGLRRSAAGVALSVAWTFSDGAGALPALSLGVGRGGGARAARAPARAA